MPAQRHDTPLLLLSTPLAARDLPGGVCPSLANLTLGSHLRHLGAPVEVFDPSVDLPDTASNASVRDIVAAVIARKPRVVGVSALSPVEGRFAASFAQTLKAQAPQIAVVVGGIWATASATELMTRCAAIDAVIRGPGERPAELLAHDGLSRPERIPGLLWRSNGALSSNPVIDSTPSAAPLDLSLMANPSRYDIFCWMTSRGCPFDCGFCTEALTSPDHRPAPAARVTADLDQIAALGLPWYLWLCDPLFGASRPRLATTTAALTAAGLPYLTESRVDVLNPDDVPAMAASGCDLIYFGLEAANGNALRGLDKIGSGAHRLARYLEGALALCEACLRAGILPVFGVLEPAPGAIPSDLVETLAFLKRLAALPGQLGPAAGGLAPCFHAFPLRLDRGAPLDGQQDALAALGATFSVPDDPLFGDRYLERASHTVDAEMAAAFRKQVAALNVDDPRVQRRLWRSFPRRYVDFQVGEPAR